MFKNIIILPALKIQDFTKKHHTFLNAEPLGEIFNFTTKNVLLLCAQKCILSDMNKTANLYARIEPDVKEQAENVLETLGISVSSAINMFYKQIILQQGIPFDVKIPKAPENSAKWSKERLDAELEKGYNDMLKGRTRPAAMVLSDVKKKYKV